MKRQIITTADGSRTIHLLDWNEHYHSIHGAIQEANHVFIKHGLLFFLETFLKNPSATSNSFTKQDINSLDTGNNRISILEIGFGTGLNALITLIESQKMNVEVDYVGVEAFPVSSEEWNAMNYAEELKISDTTDFDRMHQAAWESPHVITPNFSLTKQKKTFDAIEDHSLYDLIYFDAFGARVQPELWTEAIFQKMYDALKPNGVLTTYAAKGSVRRAMIAVGFNVEKLPGPPGKREMLRARKGA